MGITQGNIIARSETRRCLQALYFLSSFFGQFGPNATTWLLPGEVFPTDIRATCHGISAATGKVGALVAGIWFAYLTNAGKFYVAAFFNLVRSSPPVHPTFSCSASAGCLSELPLLALSLSPLVSSHLLQCCSVDCGHVMARAGLEVPVQRLAVQACFFYAPIEFIYLCAGWPGADHSVRAQPDEPGPARG